MPHAELFHLLRRTEINVVDCVGLYPSDDAVARPCYETYSVERVRKWPREEIWLAEKAR